MGVSFVSVGISIDGLPKITYTVCGIVIILLTIIGVVLWVRKHKELEKIDKDAKFACDFILKIEEKLL